MINEKTNNYDYIIVGGGSAGCVLANRLSSIRSSNVLLIEAGKKNHFLSRIPISFGLFIDKPSVNWCYRSEPEQNTNFREIPVPRGKILGGSSTINGMVYVRGHAEDFDGWSELGCEGWSYADVLPYFIRMEAYSGGDKDYRLSLIHI